MSGDHRPTFSPVYALRATYVTVSCSCGWRRPLEAWRTKREAIAEHASHVEAAESAA